MSCVFRPRGERRADSPSFDTCQSDEPCSPGASIENSIADRTPFETNSRRSGTFHGPAAALVASFVLALGGHAEAAKTKKTPKAEPAPSKVEEPAPAPEEEPAPAPLEASTEASSADPPASSSSESAAVAAPASSGARGRESLVFLEGGFRYDLGNFSRRENVGRNEQINNDAVSAVDPMFHIGFLKRVDTNFRFGGAFGYGGNYDVDNGGQVLGQLLTLDARMEFTIPVEEKLSIIAGPKVGVSVLIPGGILQERIAENQNFGYDTWSGPRYGFLLGVDGGVRYQVNDWFSLRATVGYAWGMFFLLDSSAASEFTSASQTWQLQASRLSGNVGIEVGF